MTSKRNCSSRPWRNAGADDAGIQRILAEHADLRRRIAELERTPDTTPEVLNELGKLLSEHIRYEERTVFWRIEAIPTPEELDAVGSHLQTAGNEHLPPRARGGVIGELVHAPRLTF